MDDSRIDSWAQQIERIKKKITTIKTKKEKKVALLVDIKTGIFFCVQVDGEKCASVAVTIPNKPKIEI